MAAGVIALVAAAAAAGCMRDTGRGCVVDDDCPGAAIGAGHCVLPNGYCSVADTTCPSGWRFESRAAEWSEQCTQEPAVDAGPPPDAPLRPTAALCVERGKPPPTTDDGCIDLVCGQEPTCCSIGWDDRCVHLVQTECEQVCEGLVAVAQGSEAGTNVLRYDGLATPAAGFAVASGPTNGVAWGDFDDDGDADLATASDDNWNVWTTVRDGNQVVLSNTTRNQPEDGQRLAIAWADWDADGDLDLAIGGATSLRLMRNERGTFILEPDVLGASRITSLDLADVDGDGDLDLSTGRWLLRFDAAIQDFRLDEDSTFTTDNATRWCDFDGDHFPELVGAGYTFVNVYANEPRGADRGFAPPQSLALAAPGSEPVNTLQSSVARCADLDGDDLIDLVVGGESLDSPGELLIWRNVAGALTGFQRVPLGQKVSALELVDVDGDHALDVVLSTSGSNTGAVYTLRNASTPGTITLEKPAEQGAFDQPIRGISVGAVPQD